MRGRSAASPDRRGILAARGALGLGAATRNGARAQACLIQLIVPIPSGRDADVIPWQLAERIGIRLD